jgi:hypothetical protein
MHVAQHVGGAIAAATATGADTELVGQVLERAHAVLGALANRSLGDGVAEADVQVVSFLTEKHYRI